MPSLFSESSPSSQTQSIVAIHRTELTRVVRHDDTIADQVFFEARSLQGSLRPAPFRSAQIELGLDLPDGTEAGAEREAGGGGGEGRGERREIDRERGGVLDALHNHTLPSPAPGRLWYPLPSPAPADGKILYGTAIPEPKLLYPTRKYVIQYNL